MTLNWYQKFLKISSKIYSGWILENGQIKPVAYQQHSEYIIEHFQEFNINNKEELIEESKKYPILLYIAYEKGAVRFNISNYTLGVSGKKEAILKHIPELRQLTENDENNKIMVFVDFFNGTRTIIKEFATLEEFFNYFENL